MLIKKIEVSDIFLPRLDMVLKREIDDMRAKKIQRASLTVSLYITCGNSVIKTVVNKVNLAICPSCDNVFEMTRSDKEYCSPKCKLREFYKKKRKQGKFQTKVVMRIDEEESKNET